MNGYIAIAVRRRRANYWAEFPALPGCGGSGETADAALDAAARVLDRYAAWLARRGRKLPPPRPSWTLITEARRRGAVAAACLRPRQPAAGGAGAAGPPASSAAQDEEH